MVITLTPEMEALIRHYMVHRAYPSPESVIMQALVALQEVEAMPTSRHSAPLDQDDLRPAATPPSHVSPLVQWLQTTAVPHEGLDALHRRLAAISGSMAETVRTERDDRL